MKAFWVIGLIAVALIAFLAKVFSGGASDDSYDKTLKLTSSSIVNDGSTLVRAFSNVMATNNSPLAINFDTTTLAQNNGSTANLFNTSTNVNGINPIEPDPSSFATSGAATNKWYMQDNVKLNNVGVNSNIVFVLPGLKQDVCREINRQLKGSTSSSTPAYGIATSSGSLADWTSFSSTSKTSTALGATAINDSTNLNAGWSTGCAQTSDGSYFFYTVAYSN